MQPSAFRRLKHLCNTFVVVLAGIAPVLSSAALLFFLADGRPLHAQARPAAERPADLSVFALYNRLDPDYGQDVNNGFAFGLDYTRYPNWWVKPSLEFRGRYNSGRVVTESVYSGGIRLVKPIHEFHMYGDVLFGAGSIKYNYPSVPILPNGKPYTSDGTTVLSVGGGVDIDLWRDFSLRGDYQYEWWRLDKYTPIYLNPYAYSFGIVYHIPIHRR